MKKNQYIYSWIKLGVLVFAGIIICYLLAFSKTIDLYMQKKNNNLILTEINRLPIIIKKMEKTIESNERKHYENNGLDSLTSRQKTLDLFAIASTKFKFSVKEVSPSYNSASDSLNYELSVFTLEGNYFELLKTWNYIEKQIHFGNIPSCRFFILEDFRLNTKKLNLIIYVELLKNKNKL